MTSSQRMYCWHRLIRSLRQVQKPLFCRKSAWQPCWLWAASSFSPPPFFFIVLPPKPWVWSLLLGFPFPCCLMFLDSSVSLPSHRAILMILICASQSLLGFFRAGASRPVWKAWLCHWQYLRIPGMLRALWRATRASFPFLHTVVGESWTSF